MWPLSGDGAWVELEACGLGFGRADGVFADCDAGNGRRWLDDRPAVTWLAVGVWSWLEDSIESCEDDSCDCELVLPMGWKNVVIFWLCRCDCDPCELNGCARAICASV